MTLAQNPFAIASPQPLPTAPLWETYLFEQPWPLVAILLVVALAVLLKGRGRFRAAIPVAALSLAAGVFIASAMVTTAREKIRTSTKNLVEAVINCNTNVLDAELDPDAKLLSFQHGAGVGKEEIIAEVHRDFAKGGQFAIKDFGILELDASQDGQRVGRSLVKVRATSAALGVPVFSWWLLDYRLDSSGTWRVIRVEPQSISGVPDARSRK